MKRITFIVDDLYISGAQVQLLRLARGLTKKAHDVHVVCLGYVDPVMVDSLAADRLTRLKMDCIWSLVFWVHFFRLISFFKKTRPAIVHAYLNTSNVFGVLAARIAGVPVIVASRRDMGHFRSGIIKRLETWSSRFCHKITCVSQAVKDQTFKDENLNEQKLEVLYGGIDAEYFNRQAVSCAAEHDLVYVGVVASISRKIKGHRIFIDAVARISGRKKSVRFLLIGDGCLRKDMQEYARKKKVDDIVLFQGVTDDVRGALRNLDVFVMPSLSEGFSNAILEAMAMELPVVAFGVEGNLEIIEDGVTGYLAAPQNADDLAAKMKQIIDSAEKRRMMGQKGREKILSNFTLAHMVERYERFYVGCGT